MGRCPEVPFDPGPSHGPLHPTAVVCHRTYGAWGGDYTVGKGARGPISFHFLIGKTEGQWVQFVDTAQVAYHAKGANQSTIGVEVTGTNDDLMTDWQVAAVGHICRWISDTHGIPLDHIRGGRVPASSVRGFMDHAQVAGSDHGDRWHVGDWDRVVEAAQGQEQDMTSEQAAQLAALAGQMDWLLRYFQGVTLPQITAIAAQCDYLTRRAQAEDQARQ